MFEISYRTKVSTLLSRKTLDMSVCIQIDYNKYRMLNLFVLQFFENRESRLVLCQANVGHGQQKPGQSC